MKLRESDPLVMLAGSVLFMFALILVASGLIAAHRWK